jgi:hypothetical protein
MAKRFEPHPIEMFEDGLSLLRRGPVAAHAYYLAGVLPFLLLLLQFCCELSYTRFSQAGLPSWALVLACGYVWMKGLQAISCQVLLAAVRGQRFSFKFGECLRLFCAQALVQPFGLLLRPACTLLVLPSANTDAFFYNATIGLTGRQGDWARCMRFSRSGFTPYFAFNALAVLLRVFVFINLLVVFYALPRLLKHLFGVESLSAEGKVPILSWPIVITAALFAYFAIDWLIKASFVIRFHQLESRSSGSDILLEWRQLQLRAASGLAHQVR